MAESATERKEVKTRESGEMHKQEAERVLRPPVDIYEDSEGITLLADMPGVDRERLTLEVDRDSLTIEGDARIDMPEDMEALYADVRSTRYRRTFTLSSELSTDEIAASVKDGVLNIRIPRRAEARPRKIEVHAG